MDRQTNAPMDDATLVRNGKVIQFLGLTDVVLGASIPFWGPMVAADLGWYWWFAGAFLAVTGLGLIVYGRIILKRARQPYRTVTRL